MIVEVIGSAAARQAATAAVSAVEIAAAAFAFAGAASADDLAGVAAACDAITRAADNHEIETNSGDREAVPAILGSKPKLPPELPFKLQTDREPEVVVPEYNRTLA